MEHIEWAISRYIPIFDIAVGYEFSAIDQRVNAASNKIESHSLFIFKFFMNLANNRGDFHLPLPFFKYIENFRVNLFREMNVGNIHRA